MQVARLGTKIAAPFLCLCVFAPAPGCGPPAARAGESVSETRAESYEMRVGEERAARGADFTLRLAAVPEDSRCPEGVQCVWAGSVGVELVFCGPKSEASARLNTNRPPRVLKYRGRYVRILAVGPKKVEGREIKPADYVIILEVSRDRPAAAGDAVEVKDE
jgi:hypothetical protein